MIINPYKFILNPLSLSPSLWLDANDASTLYDATTGGSLVAPNGVVARWEDKSGNARHATQGTSSSRRPLRKTAITNGRDVLRFDGSDDWLDTSLTNDGNVSIFIVCANRNLVINATEIDSLIAFNNFPASPNNQGIGLNTANSYASTVQRRFSRELQSSGSKTIYKNGIDDNVSPANIDLNEFFVGSAIYAGIPGEGSKQMDIGRLLVGETSFYGQNDIAEIIIYPRVVTESERLAVESYLRAKWATP